jgi:cellulose 1,4-beta-cellobiosidase
MQPRSARLRGVASLVAGAALAAALASACVTPTPPTHVDNPFVGATSYVNPDYAALVDTSIARTTDPALRARMETVKTHPTAVWLDRIAAIGGGEANGGRRSLRDHLDTALAQRRAGTPITASIVIYDLPGRDCAALASNGELPLTEAGLARYREEYIDPIARIFADPRYRDIRIVALIEPDSLPNLVTNLGDPECSQAQSSGIYVRGVQYALEQLRAIPNVYTYLDLAHSGWLGWDDNRSRTVALYTEMARALPGGFATLDGFVTNTANVTPLAEPYLPDPSATVGGQPVRSARFYEWNPHFDEGDFTAAMYADLVAAGWPAGIGFLVDTGRNGWNGPGRPTGPGTSTDVHQYVDESRVDRRAHRGLWCNTSGAGLGRPPEAAPDGYAASHIDAFVWVKPPGESDGASEPIDNDEGKLADPMCDPDFMTRYGVPTGALPDAPLAGHWFHEAFEMYVRNA